MILANGENLVRRTDYQGVNRHYPGLPPALVHMSSLILD